MDLVKVSAAVACVMAATVANAADPDNYVSVDAGLVSKPDKVVILDAGQSFNGAVPSKHEVTWGFSFGHVFNRYFAIEAGYQDLGEFTADLVAGSTPVQGTYRLTTRGATLAAVGMIPFGRWEAYGKLGTMITDAHASIDGPDAANQRTSSWNVGRLGEIGIRYRITNQWDVGLAAAAFAHLGERYKTGSVTLHTTTFAVRYRF